MPSKPEHWSLDTLRTANLGEVVVVTTPSVMNHVRELALPLHPGRVFPPAGLDTVVVVGGGALLDTLKAWRVREAPDTRLVAIPSLWGSGAEVSPFAVLDKDDSKKIFSGEEYVPDVCVYWPELAASVPEHLARTACGDAWAHALEGFLSPLANDNLRERLAGVIMTLLSLPIGNDSRWFEPSSEACALQAQSSVGLVHGIAHTLEAPLKAAYPEEQWGHAKLCSTFLWPVMSFNRDAGDKWSRTLMAHDLNESEILSRLRELFDASAYAQALETLQTNWLRVLRDPCSRTNSVTVRPASLDYFTDQAFR